MQTDYPYLYYINSFTGGVCVKECPDLTNVTADSLTDIRTLITYGGIWQPTTGGSELDPAFVQVADYTNSSDAIFCSDASCFPNDSPSESWTSDGIKRGLGYAYYVGDTYELLWRCYLTTNAADRIDELVGSTGDGGLKFVDDAYDFWNKFYADIYAARKYILGVGFGVSLILSFIYIFLMRLPLILGALIWSSILATIVVFFIAGFYTYKLASDWRDEEPQIQDDQTINLTTGASVVLWVIGALLILLTVCLRKQIQLAIGSVKEAGRAVNSMPLILMVPVLQACGLVLFLAVFIYYAVHLASMGEITTKEIPLDFEGEKEISYRVFEFDSFVQNCAWFLLFCLFWTCNFIVALGDMTIALAISKWYFSREKKYVGSGTVIRSIVATVWYHAGTAAYGSLILAVIQLIRAIIAKAQKTAKRANSKIAGCVLCCCQCCFCCLECCMKFLSKNAYIQTAIFGYPFCRGCRAAFFLILRNAARIAAISYVSAAVLIIGKLFISSVTTVIGYYLITEDIEDELNSVGGPVVLIFLISYWMRYAFGVARVCCAIIIADLSSYPVHRLPI